MASQTHFGKNFSIRKPTSLALSVNLLKKEIEKFPGVPGLYKTTGLAYEYSGNLRMALKFYLIHSEANRPIWDNTLHTVFLCYWNGAGLQINIILLKTPINFHGVLKEGFFFIGKYFDYNGDHIFTQNLWKKLYKRRELFHLEGRKSKKNFISSKVNLRNFYLRSLIKGPDLEITYYSLKKIFDLKNFLGDKNFKNRLYLYHNFLELLARFKPKFLKKLKSSNFFKVQREKNSPLTCRFLSFFFEADFKNPKKNYSYEIFKFFGVFQKWLAGIGEGFLKKGLNFSFFIQNKKFFNRFFVSQESFNPFFRNPSIKINLFLKIANVQKANKMFFQVFEIYRFVALEQPDNSGLIFFLARIQKKLFSKKKVDETFFRVAKIHLQKNFGTIKKNKKPKIKTKKLLSHAEKFFEENKIIALSRLITWIFIFRIQPHLRKSNGNKKFFLRFTTSPEIGILKGSENNQNASIQTPEGGARDMSFFSFEKLLEKILFFLVKNKKIFLENTLKMLFGDVTFFKKGTDKRKFLSIFFLIGQKKFIRAYRLLRFECLTHPNSMEGWYFLSNLEKEIGLIVSKTLRYSLRILLKFPEAVPGIIFSGNHCSLFGSYGYALAEYFQAYRWKKNAPFLNFVIFLQYLKGSFSRQNDARGFAILLSLCFFWRYRVLRNFIGQNFLKRSILATLLEKEINYNFGVFYLFLGSHYLAFKYLKTAFGKVSKSNGLCKLKRKTIFSQKFPLHGESLLNLSLLRFCFGHKTQNFF